MKNSIKLLLALLFLAAGCSKSEVDLLFDKTPEQRMSEQQKEIKDQLVGAQFGWKVFNETLSRGNYGYYMSFDDKDRVKMLADINNGSSTELQESSYRLRLINGPVLAFETYNYIHLLNDPNPAVIGGARGDGLKSDIEFDFQRATADSIFFKGRKYAGQMVLVRATKQEREAYLAGEYLSSINRIKDAVQEYTNPAITVNNKVYSFKIDVDKKVIELAFVQSDGRVSMSTNKFSFGLDGIDIGLGMSVGDKRLLSLKVGTDNKLVYVDNQGNEEVLDNSPTPILPLISMFSYNGAFKTMGTPTDNNVLPEIDVDSRFKTVWQNTLAKFVSSGRSVRHFELVLTNSNTATFNLYYAAGTSNFTATVTFRYTLVDNILTLSNPSGHTSGNWNTRRAQIQELEDFLFGLGAMKIDWVPTSGRQNVAGLHSVDKPTDILYGILK